jgi:hypothetical protein
MSLIGGTKKNWLSIVWIFIWLLSTMYAVFFGLTNFKVAETYRLLRSGVETNGVITDKMRQNHQRIQYSFKVDEKKYSFSGFAGDLGKDFDQISIGEKVKVIYESTNPSNSCLGNCENIFYAELRFVVFLALIPTIAIILLQVSYLLKEIETKPDVRTT